MDTGYVPRYGWGWRGPHGARHKSLRLARSRLLTPSDPMVSFIHDHTGHGHPLTPAARKACRDSVIRVGTAVLVHLDDAEGEFDGTVLAIEGSRFYVRLTRSHLGVFVHTSRTRKAN